MQTSSSKGMRCVGSLLGANILFIINAYCKGQTAFVVNASQCIFFGFISKHYFLDLSDYYPSVEWDIMSRVAKRRIKNYPSCCPDEAYVDIMVTFSGLPLYVLIHLQSLQNIRTLNATASF